MRQTITFIAIAIAAITISCNKNDKYKIKDSTVVVNPPNTNPGVTTPTTTPTNPTDSFLHLTGTINNINWLDKGSFSVSNSAQLTLKWDQLPAGYTDVNVEINLYDEATHADRLMTPISVVIKNNSYSVTIPTNKITTACPGWLIASVVPLKGSGKKAASMTAYLN